MNKGKNKSQPNIKQVDSTEERKFPIANPAKPDMSKELKTAHYAASVQAWFGTKMEKDKSLLTLSSAGIGILVSLGANSRLEKFFYVSAILFFINTVLCTLIVFEINAKLIESLIREKNTKSTGRIANFLDYVLILSFLFGVIAFAMLGVTRFMKW
jgi:hypothetical protein